MRRPYKNIVAAFSLTVLCLVNGCMSGGGDGWRFAKSLDVRRAFSQKPEEPEPPQVPRRLVSTWEDTVLTRMGSAPQRGFGGRILFFNAESEDPIRVDGQLVVYAYDEQGREPHETHPTRRYVFPAQQFVRHESECQLGPSYSVWLPWDEAGGERKNISLIARFEPRGGALVVGDQTRHMLPGKTSLANGESAPPAAPVDEIQLTEYTETSQLSPPPAAKRRVTSIAISRETWKQRLAAARSQSASESEADTVTPSQESPAQKSPE